MPITIKEILLSDSMSGVVEKVNFNFDQLLLAGGGPPGPQGIQGIAGPVGPIGTRGDHWFAGPSAFLQLVDHDGGDLQIQDHFLDPKGDVFSFYASPGGTGWTYSGINLKGPTGETGAVGSSNEWQIWEANQDGTGIFGNITTPSYVPGPTQNSAGTINVDFIIPKNSSKNVVFLGDNGWAVSYLANFGRNTSGVVNTTTPAGLDATPKLTIIQNNVNTSGLNGLSFGAYGLTGTTSTPTYGDSSKFTDAWYFVNMGFDNNPISGGLYQSKFNIRSYRTPVRIQVGSQLGGAIWNNAGILEQLANDILLSSYDPGIANTKYIRLRPAGIQTLNSGTVNMNMREIQLVSLNNIGSTSLTSTSNTRGYIALQNVNNSGGVDPLLPEHGFGNVIIGPTMNSSTQGLGTITPQGLAIVRKITRHNTVDAGINFLQDSYFSTSQLAASAINAKLLPVRLAADAFINNALLDTFTITSGLGFADLPGIQSAGRIGFSNTTARTFKPQMPFHVSIYKDQGTRNIAFDGVGSTGQTGIQYWYAGFDSTNYQSTRNTGIGIAHSDYWYSGISTLTGTYNNPVLQTYYKDQTASINDGTDGRLQGKFNPHLYMQIGNQVTDGNVGIGFEPIGLTGATYNTGSAAFAKLSVQGSMVIGLTSSGYHRYDTSRFSNSLLLEGAIVQGATTIDKQIGTSVYGATATLNAIGGILSFSSYDQVFGRGYVSRGYSTVSPWPDFSLPDMKTGMMQYPTAGFTGLGYLVANADLINPAAGPSALTPSRQVAKFASRGEAGAASDRSVAGFTHEGVVADRPDVVTADSLTPLYVNYIHGSGSQYNQTGIYWQIPTRKSFVYIDFAQPRSATNTGYFQNTPSTYPLQPLAVGETMYLGGLTPSGNLTPVNPLPGQFKGFTLENGRYDGQVFKMLVTEVNQYNYGVMVPNLPPLNGQIQIAYAAGTQLSSRDNIVMQAEPTDTVTNVFMNGSKWPITANPTALQQPLGRPWALPLSWVSVGTAATFISIDDLATVIGKSQANSLLINQTLNTFRTENWTNTATAVNSVPTGTGFGAFRILPYRVITFQWKFDNNTTAVGCWFEISREVLVPRQAARYWGSPPGSSSIPVVVPPPAPAPAPVPTPHTVPPTGPPINSGPMPTPAGSPIP